MRYLRVLGRFWGTSLAAELEYRGNFLLATLSSLGGAVGSLFGISLLYQGGYQPGGWRFDEALLVLAAFLMLEGLAFTLLSPNLDRVVELVQKGTLDFVLLKPLDSQFWLSFRILSPWGLSDGLLGLFVWFYAGSRLGLSLADHLLGFALLALAFVMLYSLWFIIGSSSIWFVKVANATECCGRCSRPVAFRCSPFPQPTASSSPLWCRWPS